MNIQMTEELKLQLSRLAKERYQACPPMGHKHSEESKKKMSELAFGKYVGAKNPMFGKRHSKEAKEKMSESRSLAFVEGRVRGYGKNHHHGHFTSMKTGITMAYRSSWEYEAMKWLDANESVVAYQYEKVRIPYYVQGFDQRHKRHYVPDFIVFFADGHQEMWELKPSSLCTNHQTELKREAALVYCKMQGIRDYKILTKTDLIALGIL
jgi:hypothetical protein